MARQLELTIADQRALTARLRWLTLAAPELARDARPGQYLLLRCDEPGGAARLLRRPLFLAGVQPALGQVALLYTPDEPGLAWLARRRPGETLDAIGPLGKPAALDGRSRNLLLIGAGAGLGPLLLLAHAAAARAGAATLLAVAADAELLPPPFLLPPEAEYQTGSGSPAALLADAPTSPIAWADQLFVALPPTELAAVAGLVRSVRFRWERGFAQVLADLPPGCGFGACGVCAIELRRSHSLPCVDGPWYDLRDAVAPP